MTDLRRRYHTSSPEETGDLARRIGAALRPGATLLLDGGKGAAAVLLARAMAADDAVQLAGFAAFIGHCFPVWLGFKGGKGVATFLGLLLAIAWPVGVACCMTWLALALLRRISSLAALCAAVAAPLWCLVLGYPSTVALSIILTLVIFWRHKDNIARLLAGTEPKIGQK